MSEQDPRTEESEPVVFMETEGFFDFSEDEQREHIRSFLRLLSPDPEVRRAARDELTEK